MGEPPQQLPAAEGLPHQLALMELECRIVLCLLMPACMHEALPGPPRPPQHTMRMHQCCTPLQIKPHKLDFKADHSLLRCVMLGRCGNFATAL